MCAVVNCAISRRVVSEPSACGTLTSEQRSDNCNGRVCAVSRQAMRWIVAAFALGLVVFAVPHRVDACGAWDLKDVDKRLDIEWLINAGTVRRGETRVANLYLDLDAPEGVRVAAEHRVVFDVVRGKVLRYGKRVGTVDGDTITIAGHAYTLAFSDLKIEHGVREIEIDSWKLVVQRGDTVVATSERASSLCAPLHRNGMSEADQRDEVRRRVTYYLAWRELGM